MSTPKNTADTKDTPLTLPCDHSFAYSTLSESIAFSIEEIGSTTDGAMYMEISFSCPRCQTPVKVELLESVIQSTQ
ncbi:hypothetical protein BV210_19050 (plasmid) [Halorientalis sp. IM1011]|uniref:hypothetical protein n=1 Tax=Halorientalis sp. IM1011 TaxID=1932360 RepID=UPI00097CC7A8|nr:hypothetical protein [Halorientalis sp. IM1011]AQL44863.1 hypothetical protein BV210_19050 [Halorientalis sp. IM1011]